ncbi:zinc-dependent alcohol dehydrogenase family protein [Azospirillum sp.]|uniref:zinc-dependent alcohol dehydrogenase family protein n=1 Tax=Azospirillum sp. TaxID=34012 RepID=UPI002D26ABBE|nr:zinc-dependent alcohol dehydrogenase family protein [Azospirillum sp.]HYD69155.1 zinc-dependent alcohol dehydrogenase family protein [Azospirillum sp.]
MHLVRFSRFGTPADVAELIDAPEPTPPLAGEALVDVVAAPINPADLLRLEGRYGNTTAALPAFGGGEGVGRVAATGPGVEGIRAGDLVLLNRHFVNTGIWRERLTAPAEALEPLPEADPLQLAMLSINPATAWLMLARFVALRPGDWVMQNAANSATGHWLIKLAATLGVNTINVVRREDAAAELRAFGARHVLVDGPDLAERVGRIAGANRPCLAVDAVGGEATQRLAAAVAEGGVVVNYGLLSGEACRVASHDTVFRDVSLRGFWLHGWLTRASREERGDLYQTLARLVANGDLSVPVEATYPLARVREALEHAARPGRTGKILLTGRLFERPPV